MTLSDEARPLPLRVPPGAVLPGKAGRPDRFIDAPVAGCGLLLAAALLALGHVPTGRGSIPLYLGLYFLAFTLYGAAAARVARSPHRVSVPLIILFSTLFHLLLVSAPPARSTDVYRYLWEGKLILLGVNPLLHSPMDPTLAALRNSTWRLVNNRTVASVYPTVSQVCFAIAALVAPGSVMVWKVWMSLFNLATAVVLAAWLRDRKLDPARCLLYAWSPLPLTEIALNGHQDAIGIFFLVLALRLGKVDVSGAGLSGARSVGAGLSLAASIFAKGYAVLALPFLYRKGRARLLLSAGAASLLLAAPLFAGWSPGSSAGPWSGFVTYSTRWERNDLFFKLIRSAAGIYAADPQRAALLLSVILAAVIWIVVSSRERTPAPGASSWRLLSAMGWFLLLSPTVYPWYAVWLLPLASAVLSPAWLLFSCLVGLDYVHAYRGAESMPVLLAEYLPVIGCLLLRRGSAFRGRAEDPDNGGGRKQDPADKPIGAPARIGIVIPALNEEAAIGKVIAAIDVQGCEIVVVDNGSSDGTAEAARAAGARVVGEGRRGYGAACLAGMAALGPAEIVVFLDGDYSDDPAEMSRLLAPLLGNRADLVIGSRMLGRREPGALPIHAVFGNWLAAVLLRLLYRQPATDLGPFRAIRREALDGLGMEDKGYGWTVEMQIKAAQHGLRVEEVPVSYRRRVGKSKISGSLIASLRAGATILWVLFRSW